MILLTIAYDGTSYAGWQRQINAVTVQQVLEEALSKLFRCPAAVIGGSRTDAGVHAIGQKALIQKPADVIIPVGKLTPALNSLLPQDIRVMGAETVPGGFHPLRQSARKTYEYSIYNAPVMLPVYRLYAAFERRPLDVVAMKEAGRYFIGLHNFKGFSSTGSRVETTVREIFSLDVGQAADLINIKISGNGFLYNMVRIIAGTLLYVGLGKICAGDIPGIILSGDREQAGKTMPAQGLLLKEIQYLL